MRGHERRSKSGNSGRAPERYLKISGHVGKEMAPLRLKPCSKRVHQIQSTLVMHLCRVSYLNLSDASHCKKLTLMEKSNIVSVPTSFAIASIMGLGIRLLPITLHVRDGS